MTSNKRNTEIVSGIKAPPTRQTQANPMTVDFGMLVSQNQQERQMPIIQPKVLKGSYRDLAGDDSDELVRTPARSSNSSFEQIISKADQKFINTKLEQYLGTYNCSPSENTLDESTYQTEETSMDTEHLMQNSLWSSNNSNLDDTPSRSYGLQHYYTDIRQRITQQQIQKVWWDFATDVLALTFVLFVLLQGIQVDSTLSQNEESNGKISTQVHMIIDQIKSLANLYFFEQDKQECGVPMRSWLTTFFGLFGIRSFLQLIKIYFLQHYFQNREAFDIIRLTLIDGFVIGWLIYGNHMFLSHNNDCGAQQETKFLNYMMAGILVIGFVSIIVYFALLGSIIYDAMCNGFEIPHLDKNEESIKKVLGSLSRIQFTTGKFDHDSQCGICLSSYKPMEMVTQLNCDKRHYFHTECIEKSVKQGHDQCPYCREQIKCKLDGDGILDSDLETHGLLMNQEFDDDSNISSQGAINLESHY